MATEVCRRYAEMGEDELILDEVAVFVREDHPSPEMIAGAAGELEGTVAELCEQTRCL